MSLKMQGSEINHWSEFSLGKTADHYGSSNNPSINWGFGKCLTVDHSAIEHKLIKAATLIGLLLHPPCLE